MKIKRAEKKANGKQEVADLKAEVNKLRAKLRALKKDQYLFNILLDTIPDTIYFKDKKSRFIRTSKSLATYLGQTSEENLIGKSDFDVHGQELAQQAFNDEKKIMITGRPIINREEKQIHAGNKIIWKSSTKMPLRSVNGTIIGTFGISRDITAKKQAELESKAKEYFLTNMSHEIRTPMNAVLGLSEVLLKTNLSASQRNHLETIRNSADSLLVIINDILDLSKLHAKKLSLENNHFRLRDVLTSITDMFQAQATQKGLELTYHLDENIPSVLIGDAGRLKQIILNLVGNAIKFTHSGRVDVSCTLIKTSEKWYHVNFKVSDTGIGMADTSHIFEAYEQETSNTVTNFGGTGLGLAICKELTDLFRGTIKVSSKPGKGSVFNVSIPLCPGSEEALKQAEYDNSIDFKILEGKEVLVVEDHEINQMVASSVLKQLGMKMDIANNGQECLKKLSAKGYDIILMDLRMPVMNGYDATKFIRNKMELDVPIITMTANAMHGEKERCIKAGMNDYISKPFRPDQLAEKMARLISGKDPKYKNRTTNIPKAEKELKLYSLDKLPEVMSTDKAMRDETLKMFIEGTPKLEEELNHYLEKNEITDVQAVAHKLKSSFDLFQIKESQQLIRWIENLPANYSKPELKRKIRTLQNTTKQVIKQMKKELAAL